MSKVINTYPDWVEKYRGKGKTIRKTANGYGLYKCTSVYDKSKGYPRSKQEFLGMIDEEKGFIPKVKKNGNPEYIEYGLSSFIMINFKRELVRSSYGTSKIAFKSRPEEELLKLLAVLSSDTIKDKLIQAVNNKNKK